MFMNIIIKKCNKILLIQLEIFYGLKYHVMLCMKQKIHFGFIYLKQIALLINGIFF